MYSMCMRLRLMDGSRFVDLVSEVVRVVKYFPNAVHLAVDCTMFSNIHCLHFYPRARFSYRIDISMRVFDQTWTLIGEHSDMAVFRRV